MIETDEFSQHYKDLLDGTYDCVDRIVLNAYFNVGQSGGGLRAWWRKLNEGDDSLDDTHLMRFAGRCSRRVRAYAVKRGIPLLYCTSGDDKHKIAEQYIPKDPGIEGVFCILVDRAPATVFEVKRFKNGMDVRKKDPRPYVYWYSFHIMDPDWGHMTIRLSPHPPFNAQIILNGHEYVAIQAKKRLIAFTKDGNCFTDANDIKGLNIIADTMRVTDSVGRLGQLCDRWIYSACLCFALDCADQEKSEFRYSYSVYQVEYSRNLMFIRGHTLDQVFNSIIDRTRAPLGIPTVKTIFGYHHRPFKRHSKGKPPRFEVVIEKPAYNMTVFRVHLGKLTVRIYSKGERILRIESVVHNTRAMRCGHGIDRFPKIIDLLKGILERFLGVLRCLDVSFIDDGALQTWPLPSAVGATRVGGVNVHHPRTRAVMDAIIMLAMNPRGFSASDLAGKVRERFKDASAYNSRQASYDLKKFRGKNLVERIDHSQRYMSSPDALRAMVAFIALQNKVLLPLLANAGKRTRGKRPENRERIDTHYDNIQIEMQNIFNIIGIAA